MYTRRTMAQDALLTPQELIEGDFFELAGLQNISEEEKETLMGKILDGLRDKVLIRIDDLLEDADKTHFQQLIQSADDTAIDAFLQNKSINIQQITAEEALLQKNNYLTMLSSHKDEQPQPQGSNGGV